MRRSWLGLQLALSCALLLAMVVVEARCCKEKEGPSEEECHCEKRHHCVEERCKKRCHPEEDECCCKKRCHPEEDECCCKKRCHPEEDECCCKKRHHHRDDECGEKKHSHAKEEAGQKKHSHVEKEEAGKNKDSPVEKKHPRKRHPSVGKLGKENSESSELYNNAKEEQERIMRQAAQSTDAVSHYNKDRAIAHFNRGSGGSYYKHLEDGQTEFKKAIGVMVYVKMPLAKTNCTKPKEQEAAGVEYSRAYLEKEGCQLLPKLKQEKHTCTFGIFIDMRTEKKAVVSEECTPIPRIKQSSSPLKGLAF